MSSPQTPRPPRPMRITIDETTLAHLEARGEVTPVSDGYRKISVRCYSSISSPESHEMTRFPIVAESIEFLKLAGFTQEAAEEVFRNFKRARGNEELGDLGYYCELGQVARGYIRGRARILDACLPGDDYRAAWKCQGMAASRCDRALAPEFDAVRLKEAASAHFIASVRATADYVFSLAKNIRTRQPPSQGPSSARSTGDAQPQVKGIVQTEVNLPHAVPGCTMLHKAASLATLQSLFPNPASTRTRFERLVSTPPTDFHRQSWHIMYTTNHLELAEIQCGFAAALSGDHLRQGILHIAIPTKLLQRPDFRRIDGKEWQRLIWANRGSIDPMSSLWDMPSDLTGYVSGFGLAGNICDTSSNGLERLEGEEDVHALKLSDGSKAMQYAFLTNSYPLLNSQCEGQVWIEVRGLTAEGKLEESSGRAFHRAKKP